MDLFFQFLKDQHNPTPTITPIDRDVSSLAYVLVDSHAAFIIRMCDTFI